jgi:hypothetical protein
MRSHIWTTRNYQIENGNHIWLERNLVPFGLTYFALTEQLQTLLVLYYTPLAMVSRACKVSIHISTTATDQANSDVLWKEGVILTLWSDLDIVDSPFNCRGRLPKGFTVKKKCSTIGRIDVLNPIIILFKIYWDWKKMIRQNGCRQNGIFCRWNDCRQNGDLKPIFIFSGVRF